MGCSITHQPLWGTTIDGTPPYTYIKLWILIFWDISSYIMTPVTNWDIQVWLQSEVRYVSKKWYYMLLNALEPDFIWVFIDMLNAAMSELVQVDRNWIGTWFLSIQIKRYCVDMRWYLHSNCIMSLSLDISQLGKSGYPEASHYLWRMPNRMENQPFD